MYFYHMLAKFLGYPAKLVSGASLPMTINDFQYGDFYEYICVNNFLLFFENLSYKIVETRFGLPPMKMEMEKMS